MRRAEQREQTRARIVDAAVEVFAAHGFGAASTRAIAERAEVTQGLVTYHFASKDELWRAAADRVFGRVVDALPSVEAGDRRNAADVIRAHVTVSARHPEVFHFMNDAGRHDDDRMRWLVDTHLAPLFAVLTEADVLGSRAAHLYYAVVGASSLMFAVAPECRALTGLDPDDEAVIEAHAELLIEAFARPS